MQAKRLLVVESHDTLRNELTQLFFKKGFDVETARSFLDFQKLEQKGSFDLFVVELNPLDGDGLDIIREIRRASDAGIVVISADSQPMSKVAALELGADDYVEKPLSNVELAARAKRLMQRVSLPEEQSSSYSSDSLVEFNKWKTDLYGRVVFSPAGQQVNLTRLEFDLWVTLLRNKGRVMTRDQLIYAIRGREWSGYDRAIDGLMSRLKNKFRDADKTSDLFTTIRGIGYRLDATEAANTDNLQNQAHLGVGNL